MKNYIQPGNSVTVPAPAAVTSGQLVIVGNMFGIAATDAESGADVALATGGVYELPKTEAQAWTVGAVIYATSAGVATTVSSGNTKVGVAAAAAANPSATGLVRLNASF